jgi:hypothetical protein
MILEKKKSTFNGFFNVKDTKFNHLKTKMILRYRIISYRKEKTLCFA